MRQPSETVFTAGQLLDPSAGPSPVPGAILARSGQIAAIGNEADIRDAAPNAIVVDLKGAYVMPGWVDSHVHLRQLGQSLGRCDLSAATSRNDAVKRVANYAQGASHSEWIIGHGFNLNSWEDSSYPAAANLDQAVANRPCAMFSMDLHSVWVNTAAMKAAGIARGSSDPEGGVIVRDSRGRPTGYLLESADAIVKRAIPAPSAGEEDRFLLDGIEAMVSRGHTAVHCMGTSCVNGAAARITQLERLYPNGSCPLRIRLFGKVDDLETCREHFAVGDDRRLVSFAGIKCFADGALGSRTAWLFEPFLDASVSGEGNCGISVIDNELRRLIRLTNEASLSLICHAIGDRACSEVLDAFEQAGDPDAGNRIEHAQILRKADMHRFAPAGVAASMQPAHIWGDWRPTDRLLGPERAQCCFAMKSLLQAGAVLAVGSDAPVVQPDPLASFQAAVTRTDGQGNPSGGWHPQECITPAQWAQAASWGAWQSIGQGHLRGKLEVGMDCDLTILRRNILTCNPADISPQDVVGTVVAGRVTGDWA